ncbi:hypothetical protein N7535_003480 [Penicillium sp. DV-2018c]|nr:hypothetical protein N7535_003480 [Penicillium sp. DV-2018c]
MSSGFVSAGTSDQPTERDEEWRRAQQELEEERRRKAEVGKQNNGKSLFEVLEQNKMAKQEAFEEKTRLRNQFRSLDEDEVEFLDSVLESTRAQEAAVKRETAAQLEAFRRQREAADKALLETTSSDVAPAKVQAWDISARKRRRTKERKSLIPGKKRKDSAGDNTPEKDTQKLRGEGSSSTTEFEQEPGKTSQAVPAIASKTTDPATQPKVIAATGNGPSKTSSVNPPQVALGLGGYSSDSE